MAGLLKRNGIYYALYHAGTRQRRVSLRTDNYQISKAKLAELEHAQAQGHDSPLPTRTPIESVLEKYAHYVRSHKTPKSAHSMIKRNLGSSLFSHSDWAQCSEMMLLCLTHNLMIRRCSGELFYRAFLTPFIPLLFF